MDRAGVAAWMDGYRRAWVDNDPDQVEALFTEDAVYAADAFQPAWNGRDEIIRRWTAGISQDVDMDADVWAVDGDLALVHWNVTTRNHGDPRRGRVRRRARAQVRGRSMSRASRMVLPSRDPLNA